MAVNGKQKGNRFERDISNTLSARFQKYTGVESGFYRNPNSGSFYGGKNVIRTETHNTDFAVFGDIVCPKKFNYTIECKNYKTPPTFDSMLGGEIKQWDSWIEQATQDSIANSKRMLLIIKYNRTKVFCIVDETEPFEPIMVYKDKKVVLLDSFLTADDTHYFSEDLQVPFSDKTK